MRLPSSYILSLVPLPMESFFRIVAGMRICPFAVALMMVTESPPKCNIFINPITFFNSNQRNTHGVNMLLKG